MDMVTTLFEDNDDDECHTINDLSQSSSTIVKDHSKICVQNAHCVPKESAAHCYILC